jgi:NADH:ubiquinone oxidoreductase subunit C
MLIKKNDIIINKTKFFSIFLINILKKYINGLKINKNQINILTDVTKMLYIITFLKNNTISYFDKLIDIIIVDHISNINRFEINYIF